ncbi:transcriptional regulator [Pseudidiomarina planktonica]|uniref:Transcriptional regulator n=2 Tax=Pseudidiomarina planktonica TaxID=1323738 RepID=A0A1Y6EQJ6_9GAMM|nr:transcriptional regulator [Pseudidiomarina planktonica]
MLERLSDMAIYAKVVETGSFTQSADDLQLSKGAVSKAVSRLEAHLELRLLHRTTRKMSVTLEGRAFYEYCQQVVEQAAAAEHHLGSFREQPSGRIRVTAPVTFGSMRVAPLIPELLKQYPQLEVELVLHDKRIDLISENIDIAIRCGVLENSTLIARRLQDLPTILVATPAYLQAQGTPKHPAELSQHQCLTISSQDNRWRFRNNTDEALDITVGGRLSVNNNLALKHALLADLGIAFTPLYQVTNELAEGKLVAILDEFMPKPTLVHAVYRHRGHVSAAFKVTLDFLREHL